MINYLDIKIPELENKFEIQKFRLCEKVGGEIAHGEMLLTFMRDNLTTDIYEMTVTISDKSGYQLKFPIYAYDVVYNITSLGVKFICSKPDFIKVNQVKSHESVIQAINANWDQNFEYNGSDIQCSIHQRSETGYQLVNKLIRGLKFHSIYGFRCDSVFVREIDNNFDYISEEPEAAIQTNSIHINKSKVSELEVVTEDIGVCTSVSYSRNFKQCRTEYKELLSNYYSNEAFLRVFGSTQVDATYNKLLPEMIVGNIVKVPFKDTDYENFIIFDRVFDWELNGGVSNKLKLIGYEW